MRAVHCGQGGFLSVGGPLLSQTAEYALRAVVAVAQRDGAAPMQAAELAQATDVPETYLRKVLHELVRAGILRSSRGKHGGFALARPAGDVTLLMIVSHFDAISDRRRCLLGRPECSDRDPCPMHAHWKATAEHVARFFQSTTVADVVGRTPSRAAGGRR